jgi:hypothetical protein
MGDSKSFSVGLPVGQYEPLAPIGSSRELIGDKKRSLGRPWKGASLLVYCSTLRMEAICSCETSIDFQRTTRYYIPEHNGLYKHRCENFRFYTLRQWFVTFIFSRLIGHNIFLNSENVMFHWHNICRNIFLKFTWITWLAEWFDIYASLMVTVETVFEDVELNWYGSDLCYSYTVL